MAGPAWCRARLFCLSPFVDLFERVAEEWGRLALFAEARVVMRIVRSLIAAASLPGARGRREPSRGVEAWPFWLKNAFRSSREGPVGRETSFGAVKSFPHGREVEFDLVLTRKEVVF